MKSDAALGLRSRSEYIRELAKHLLGFPSRYQNLERPKNLMPSQEQLLQKLEKMNDTTGESGT